MALTSLVIGVFAGTFSVLFGVGGGLLMVPAMTLLLNMRPQRAVGTSLAVVLPLAAFGVTKYLVLPEVQEQWAWATIVQLALGGVLGAILGAAMANALGARQLRRVFGVVVVTVGLYLMLTPQLAHAREVAQPPWSVMLLVGVGVGTISGLLGIGGGLVMVPLLAAGLGFSQKAAQAISLAVIVPVSISGTLAHFRHGNVSLPIGGWMTVGALLGAQVMGARLGQIENPTLRVLFGVFLVVVGATMILRRRRRAANEGGPPPTAAVSEDAPGQPKAG